MKFGLLYLPTHISGSNENEHLHNIVEQVVAADKMGLDYAWMVEHHFVRHGGLCAANFSILSYLAAKTSHIRLATGAVVMPLNDPVRVAEWGATLDQLSNGRFDLGLGRGFVPGEFDAFGVPMSESRGRMEEGIEIIKKAWTDGRFEFAGGLRGPISQPLLPTAYQKPHPPLWVACSMSPESFQWTAENGHNLLYVAYHVDPEVAQDRINWYRKALVDSGRRVEDFEIGCAYHGFFQKTADLEALRATVEKPMAEYSLAGAEAMDRDPDPVAYKGYSARQDYHNQVKFETYYPKRVVMGSPQQVIDRIHELEAMGITQICFVVDFGSLSHEDIMGSLAVFGEHVLPHFRKTQTEKVA